MDFLEYPCVRCGVVCYEDHGAYCDSCGSFWCPSCWQNFCDVDEDDIMTCPSCK